jgi:hypothetical protein
MWHSVSPVLNSQTEDTCYWCDPTSGPVLRHDKVTETIQTLDKLRHALIWLQFSLRFLWFQFITDGCFPAFCNLVQRRRQCQQSSSVKICIVDALLNFETIYCLLPAGTWTTFKHLTKNVSPIPNCSIWSTYNDSNINWGRDIRMTI